MQNTQSKIKQIKTEKDLGATCCSWCKDFTHNFRSQEVKMTNKVFRETCNCVASQSNKSMLLKQKHYKK